MNTNGYRPKPSVNIEKLLKLWALAALIFALTGIGFGQWEKQWEKIVKIYQTNMAASARAWKAYWEADYWKRHEANIAASAKVLRESEYRKYHPATTMDKPSISEDEMRDMKD